MTPTSPQRHPFLDDLAADAELTGTVLRKPIQGRENIRRLVQAVGTLYTSQTPTFLGTVQGRTFLEYHATLQNGQSLQAIGSIERGADENVVRVNISMGPLDAVLSLSAHLAALVGGELGAEHFL